MTALLQPAPTRAKQISPSESNFSDRMADLERDPFLSIVNSDMRLISVFDDLRYDRADLDMVTGSMRRYVVAKLAPLGFKQVSGSVIENSREDIRVLIPKIHALGASPFDATRYLARRPQDYALLTPTQTACQLIDRCSIEDAVEQIKALIVKHPINLLKIVDHFDRSARHQEFSSAIGHLMFIQRNAVESDPLIHRRALR